jgi:biopolymer transport protein ExbD
MFDWDEKPDLNITPLVDVMLVLLAIMMVTTPIMVYEENITLPNGSRTKPVNKLPAVEIRIDSNRDIKIKENIYNFSNFTDNFILYSQNIDKTTPVYIRAHRELLYNDVVFILKTTKEAGFTKVSLVTDG